MKTVIQPYRCVEVVEVKFYAVVPPVITGEDAGWSQARAGHHVVKQKYPTEEKTVVF
jgi:hypothetical protein